jgi:hypothetical protein
MSNLALQAGTVLNLIKKSLIPGGVLLTLAGCGVNNNVTFTANNGICASGLGNNTSPYCMSIVIQNNTGGTGGQNFINSTNFPISQISFDITGINNLWSPATNPSGSANSMDPNNCAGSTIQPGKTCTFFLQLNKEAFPVQSLESVVITVNYTINNTLFGGSTNTASTSTTVYELTNLYIAQNSGTLNVYNNAWTNYGLVESADVINSMAIDTNSFGLVYLGGNNGVYGYGLSNSTISGSISPSGYSGANNLIPNGANLYAALSTGGSYNLWNFSFPTESWVGQLSTAVLPNLVTNANALISNISALYLTNGTTIYACSAQSGGSILCPSEGTTNITGTITTLGFTTLGTGTSGLYAGTTATNGTGIFYESGTTPNTFATWGAVSNESLPVTAMAVTGESSGTNILLAGDSGGNLWYVVSESPTVANLLGTVPGGSISTIAIDTFGAIIYVTAGNSVYACTSNTCNSTPVYTITNVASRAGGSSNIQGMVIGSMLINSLNNPYNAGGLVGNPL